MLIGFPHIDPILKSQGRYGGFIVVAKAQKPPGAIKTATVVWIRKEDRVKSLSEHPFIR
jgi:hypothetical protein